MPGRLLYRSNEDFYAAQKEKDKRERLAGMTPRQIEVDKQARENIAQYQELKDPESLTNVAKGFDERFQKLKLTPGPEATKELKDLKKSVESTNTMAYGRPVGSGVLLPKPGTHYLSDIGFPFPGTENKPIITDNNNIGDSSGGSMASTTRMPKKQVFNLGLTSKGAQTVDPQSLIPTGEDMIKTGKEVSAARMKDAERSTSKNRFGLFGNYGKDVEIRKVRDASTGLISKQKFVDGERVQSGKERRAARRSFRRFK